MGGELETKGGVLQSIRKLLGGDDPDFMDPETTAETEVGDKDDTLELSDTKSEDALVLGPDMRAQKPDETVSGDSEDDRVKEDDLTVSPNDLAVIKPDPAGAAHDGEPGEDAGRKLIDTGLGDPFPPVAELKDSPKSERQIGDADKDESDTEGSDRKDFDPTVWPPVLSVVRDDVEAKDTDEPALAPVSDRSEEALEELSTHVEDDKLEEIPVSDQSEGDDSAKTASDVVEGDQDKTLDKELAGELDAVDSDGPEDFQELLEDTVRRIVREELSGEMGQRLSQNIQKMVRDQVTEAVSTLG